MSRHLDPAMFPRAAAYLDALGDDLNAYPTCRGRANIYADIKETSPELVDGDGISQELASALVARWPKSGWISEVLGVTLLCMARDRLCSSVDEFWAWNHERLSSIFRTPMYRALMYVMSPTLVFMGTGRRWSSMHEGSDFTSSGNKEGGEGRLTFPAHLFPETFLDSLRSGVHAAMQAAGAKDVEVELVEFSSTQALYRGRWT